MASVNLGRDSLLSKFGHLAGRSQDRQKENQQTALEMMKAGFAPEGGGGYQPTYGGQPAGQGLLSSILGGFREADLLDPSSLGAAPWHQASIAGADRAHAASESEKARTHATDEAAALAGHQAKMQEDRQAHERGESELTRKMHIDIAKLKVDVANKRLAFDRDQQDLLRSFNITKLEKEDLRHAEKMALEQAKLDWEKEVFFRNEETGEFFISQAGGQFAILKTKGDGAGTVEFIDGKGVVDKWANDNLESAIDAYKTLLEVDKDNLTEVQKTDLKKRQTEALQRVMNAQARITQPGEAVAVDDDDDGEANVADVDELLLEAEKEPDPQDVEGGDEGSDVVVDGPEPEAIPWSPGELSVKDQDITAEAEAPTDYVYDEVKHGDPTGPPNEWNRGLTPDQMHEVNDRYAVLMLNAYIEKETAGAEKDPRLERASKDLSLLEAGQLDQKSWRDRYRFLYNMPPRGGQELKHAIREQLFPRGGDLINTIMSDMLPSAPAGPQSPVTPNVPAWP